MNPGEAQAELRRTPPKQFVKTRKRLAKELRDSGEEGAAKALEKTPKPNPSVWAINALHREAPDVLKRLLDAGEALRRAHRKALGGAGGGVLKEASQKLSDEVAAAVNRTTSILSEAGESTSATVTSRLRETLLAAAKSGEDVHQQLRTGTLSENLSAAGFGLMAPLRVVETPKTRESAAERKERERAEKEAARRRELAEKRELERKKKALAEAEKKAKRLERLAADAQQRAEAAGERAATARAEADERRRELEK